MTYDIGRASMGNPALRGYLDDLHLRVEKVETTSGVQTGLCPKCQFSVWGVDGHFLISIANPSLGSGKTVTQNRQILTNASLPTVTGVQAQHVLRSSLTREFDSSGDVRSYGPDTKTSWDISDCPDQTRYWQLSSSWDGGKSWNKWADYTDPILCGISPVWSGQIRSTTQSPRTQLNVTNYATVDSVLDGSTATIRVYGPGGVGTPWTRKVGGSVEGPYPSGTLKGYALDTWYDVYYDKRFGLYRVFLTDTEFPGTLEDRFRFAGRVQTIGTGGATPTVTIVVIGGVIVSVSVTSGGTGFTSAPAITFVDSTGHGATATCHVSGGALVSVTVGNGGTGYTGGVTATFSGGHGGSPGGGGPTGGPTGGPVNGPNPNSMEMVESLSLAPSEMLTDSTIVAATVSDVSDVRTVALAYTDTAISRLPGGGLSSLPTFVDGEVVAGSGTTWTLGHTPAGNSLLLFQKVAGFADLKLRKDVDFTIAGTGIRTTNSLTAGDLQAWYRY